MPGLLTEALPYAPYTDQDPLTTILLQLQDATQQVLQYQAERIACLEHPSTLRRNSTLHNLDERQVSYEVLTRACQAVVDAFTNPIDRLLRLTWSYTPCVALQYVSKHRLAAHVPLKGSISYEELAIAAEVNEQLARRMIKTCIAYDVFCEPSTGFVAHTATSELLLDSCTTAYVSYNLEEIFPAASHALEASTRYPASQERQHSAWNVAHGTDLPFFDFMETQPDRMRRFMQSMEFMARFPGYEKDFIAEGFNWASLGKGIVVDVGGGKGHVSLMLSSKFPELQFKVQDLDSVITAARKQLAGTPAFDHGQVDLQANDMFSIQPVRNADVYFMRFILHDYPDKYAVKILKSILAAMGPHSRIVIAETLLPAPGTLPRDAEIKLRCMDTRMMLKLNAVERDLDGFGRLFREADPRLHIRNVCQPPESILSFIELGFSSGEQ